MSTPPPSNPSPGQPSSGGLPGGGAGSGAWGQQPPPGQQPGGDWGQATHGDPHPGGWGGGAGPGGGAAAGWGSRVGAYLLDSLILVVPFLVLLAIFGGLSAGSIETTTDPTTGQITTTGGAGLGVGIVVLYILFFVATIVYYGYFTSKWNGQTPGKRILNIRAARLDGRPFTFGFGVVREFLVKGILMGICFIVTILNWLWPLWDANSQALHDKVVSTHVVRT